MIRKLKNNQGITLISMILAIIVIFIILGTINYSSRNSFQVRNLKSLYSDIDSLNDLVSVYYLKNQALPVYGSKYNFDGVEQDYQVFSIPNTYSDSSGKFFLNFEEAGRTNNTRANLLNYGILDFSKLDNVKINQKNNIPEGIDSGEFFKQREDVLDDLGNVETKGDLKKLQEAIKEGIFVVNLYSNSVYYTKGISSDGKKYYTKDEASIEAPKISKKDDETVEQKELSLGVDNSQSIKEEVVYFRFIAEGATEIPSSFYIRFDDANYTNDIKTLLKYHLDKMENKKFPSKLGYVFNGWAYEDGNVSSILLIPNGKQYDYRYSSLNPQIDLNEIKNSGNNIINIYAYFSFDDTALLCYYPSMDEANMLEKGSNIGGIKPHMYSDMGYSDSNNMLARTSNIKEGTDGYFGIDIPSSGYKISWYWLNGEDYETWLENNDSKMAMYRGVSNPKLVLNSQNCKVNNGYGIKRVTYISTEPGTIFLKGRFSDFYVQLEDGRKVNLQFAFEAGSKDLKIFNSCKPTNSEPARKDKGGECLTGGSVYDNTWQTGKDGCFTVPSQLETYISLGITTPDNTNDYNESSSDYYLKNIVFTLSGAVGSINNQFRTVKDDTIYKGYELGEIVKIPFIQNDNNSYCFYPCFGVKNYKMISTNNMMVYQENLQEAYDFYKKDPTYNYLELLKYVNSDTVIQNYVNKYYKNTDSQKDYYYIQQYDSTYDKNIELSEFNDEELANSIFEINTAQYTLSRKGQIIIGNLGSYKSPYIIFSKNESFQNTGLVFKETNNDNIILYGNSKLKITNNFVIKSTNSKSIVYVNDSSSLYILSGTIENTKTGTDINTEPVINASTSGYAKVCLGMDSSESTDLNVSDNTNDDKIKIKNNCGYAVKAIFNNLYWNYGILYSNNFKYKGGVDSSTIPITADGTTRTPIIYKDSNNQFITKLGNKKWEITDKDSGAERTYYTNNLQNAVDMIDISNVIADTRTANRISGDAEDINADKVTIKRKMVVDYKGKIGDINNSSNPNERCDISNSKIIIDNGADVTIKNLCAYWSETTGGDSEQLIKNSGKLTLDLLKIRNNTNSYTISNIGELTYNENCGILGKFGIKNETSAVNALIKGKIDVDVRAIYNLGKMTVKNSECIKATQELANQNTYAIYSSGTNAKLNLDTCDIISYKSNKIDAKDDKTYGVYNYNGVVNVYGNTTISGRYAFYNSGTATIVSSLDENNNSSHTTSVDGNIGPVITCTEKATGSNIKGYAIFATNGTLTIGSNENPVSYNRNIPCILSLTNGLKINNGKVYFYDGKIAAKNQKVIFKDSNVNPNNIPNLLYFPSGYSIDYIDTTENINSHIENCKEAYLKQN